MPRYSVNLKLIEPQRESGRRETRRKAV